MIREHPWLVCSGRVEIHDTKGFQEEAVWEYLLLGFGAEQKKGTHCDDTRDRGGPFSVRDPL